MSNNLFDNPDIAFLVAATVITILILFLRLAFKSCVFLWKSTLISYIVFVVFIYVGVVWQHSSVGFYNIVFNILGPLLLVPGMLIYGLFPGNIKMCSSEFDAFFWHIIGFLFYAIVFWGVLKVIKQRKEARVTVKKQEDNFEKQIPSTDSKGG